MTHGLERRLRQLRSRVLVRSWEYRQRRHARGTWFRLRRLLADAADAYAISPEVVEELIAEGYQPDPVGAEFQPPKTIIVIPRERVGRIPAVRPLTLRLGGELLLADHFVLIPFTAAPHATPHVNAGSVPPSSAESARRS
jgi:hypothetical protein